ncbi:GntR family transcriptional regulator [Bradyrhizobium erythrophlei]|uniref:GntR family transcriptional regulator n=1 Tax=Bradyrhizobium erythrophlei TaxID=1437360 RepID=UPI0035E50426
MAQTTLHYDEASDPFAHDSKERESDTLHGEVLSRLRDLIVEGRLPPAARVPEKELCAELGVSRTPLREALKVLAAEGLVELRPNRGAHVRRFTEQDVRNMFEVLAALEAAAGRLACARITDTEIAAIERLHYEMYGHYMRRELPAYFRLNQAIHLSIVEAARNPALTETYTGFTARMRQFRYSANTVDQDRWGDAMREHEQMLVALRERDGVELGSILFDHLLRKYAAASQAIGRDARSSERSATHGA